VCGGHACAVIGRAVRGAMATWPIPAGHARLDKLGAAFGPGNGFAIAASYFGWARPNGGLRAQRGRWWRIGVLLLMMTAGSERQAE
jgi:hypothetical protein